MSFLDRQCPLSSVNVVAHVVVQIKPVDLLRRHHHIEHHFFSAKGARSLSTDPTEYTHHREIIYSAV